MTKFQNAEVKVISINAQDVITDSYIPNDNTVNTEQNFKIGK